MEKPKTYFEQVPVEVVKQIAVPDVPLVKEEDSDSRDTDTALTRPWQEIAREVAQEMDPARMIALCRELDDAMRAEESKKLDFSVSYRTVPQPEHDSAMSLRHSRHHSVDTASTKQ